MATGAVAGARAAGLVGLGARLGLIVGQQEAAASLNPADYVYATPPADVLQRLAQEQTGPAGQPGSSDGPHTAAGCRPALQGAAALPAAAAAAGAARPLAHPSAAPHSLADDLFGAQLDLDDDCLRLLLGEDADESGPCASAAGSGKGPAAGSAGSGGSQRSCATGGGAAAGAPAAGDAEAASLPAGATAAVKEEEDDIAMLFGELREPLDLHLLAGGHHHPLAAACAEHSDDAGSAAGAHGGAADADLASPSKRAKGGSPSAPAGGLHLALSMDYEKAAESINLELLGAGGAQRKAAACGDSFDMLPMLSPIMDFAIGGTPGVHTPESPDSLASGSDTVAPMPPLDSAGKRKRAVRQ